MMTAEQVRAALFKRVIFAPSGCWEYVGYRNDKHYGVYSGGQKSGWPVHAHRTMYFALVGPVEPELHLDHLCRNRACVNPQHLQPVTPRVNYLRGTGPSAMNARKTHCPAGHDYTAANTQKMAGRRVCRVCRSEQSAARLDAVRAARVPKPRREQCGNGHPRTPENVRLVNGNPKTPQCRVCQRARSLAYKARKRAERAQAAS